VRETTRPRRTHEGHESFWGSTRDAPKEDFVLFVIPFVSSWSLFDREGSVIP